MAQSSTPSAESMAAGELKQTGLKNSLVEDSVEHGRQITHGTTIEEVVPHSTSSEDLMARSPQEVVHSQKQLPQPDRQPQEALFAAPSQEQGGGENPAAQAMGEEQVRCVPSERHRLCLCMSWSFLAVTARK